MSLLLKRVREWIFSGWNTSDQTIVCSSSTGEVHRLPLDVFIQILKLLSPKDVARLAAVCKSWKVMASDNTLWLYILKNQEDWASIYFAETKLRYFPLRQYSRQTLSFMHIYGERAQASGAIIIDVGAGYCKVGWSKYDSPSLRFETLGLGNPRSPLTNRVRFFCEMIYHRMDVKPYMQPVILATPIGLYPGMLLMTYVINDFGAGAPSTQQIRDAVFSALIRMRVPSVCTVSQETLALFASRRTSGILVNIGYQKTQVFPILHGNTRHEVVSVRVGGSDLNSYLWRQLRHRNLHIPLSRYMILLKKNLCYVALDYEAELRKDTEASFEIKPGVRCTLKQERFQCGEIIFQPHVAGRHLMGLHQAVAHCIEQQAKSSTSHSWYKTIVLAGGTANLPGLAERLDKELRNLLPPNLSRGIRVITSPYGADAAWHGAKMVGNILKLLDPKDVARLAAVCKSWKLMVSDNTLWLNFLKNHHHHEDWVSIFFAESNLRYFPLRMQVEPSMQPVILVTPIDRYVYTGAEAPSNQLLRDAVFSELISMGVPSVCAINQEILALFASRRTSGILVNIGYRKTQVFPILHGNTRHEVVTIRVGGSDLTSYLSRTLLRQLVHRNVRPPPLTGVSFLKENLCYVALDYEAERRKDTEASFEIKPEGWYTLKQERFETGEILFKACIEGRRHLRGLHQAVAQCIERQAKTSHDHDWYKTIVLAGGTANLPGLAERLDKELHNLLPPHLSCGIRVITSPYGADAAWHGAKMVGNVSSDLLLVFGLIGSPLPFLECGAQNQMRTR
ncbi:hypothetical protein OSB04_026872 [Centaurea solstitialis]|uniref:F-box domain-containing protein n=1 Tax=Centaurea solstitialis TaxID=347529 RepID=A0AA38W9P3_9ASTR|nr:hypothetical protein OSB04_026872 [Centaurea solstitialis]